MKIIKGFALNRNFTNNAPGVIADIGELSTVGFSYAKEPHVYTSAIYPTLSLVHFPTGNSEVGTTTPIPDDQVDHVMRVISKVYEKSASSTSVIAPGIFLQYILDQLTTEVANVSVGATAVSGNRSIIEWIQWTNPAVDNTNLIKVWFTNSAFVGQFDEYDITVIPPFMPPNQFFGEPGDVKLLLTTRSYADEVQDIQNARAGTAETKLWGNAYNYVNPVNQNDKTQARFTCLQYGAAADNLDLLKESIVNYLLNNSDYTRDQWKNILPDLFLRTEFMIYPNWDHVAIENVVGGTNEIYSPIVNLSSALDQLVVDAADYSPDYVREYGQTLPFPFMSISLSTIGNIENRDGKMRLTDWFPDYFFVNNTSADFNRMSLDTQNWVKMISEMIGIARDMTSGSTIPIGYSRVTRGTKQYLAKSYNNVQYLIARPGTVNV